MALPLSLLLPVAALAWREAPVGTALHVRLLTPVASYSSRLGTPVRTVVIAPVKIAGQTIIPAGAQVQGRITSAHRVGLGIVHERAGLGILFDSVQTEPGRRIPLSARLVEVDNSRERVLPSGNIQGIRTTSTVSYRMSGYVRALLGWRLETSLGAWFVKSLLVQVPEPEIYYPAGAEFTLTLSQRLHVPPPAAPADPPGFAETEIEGFGASMDALPSRAHAPVSGRASDLLNIVVLGSRESVERAFSAAGWVSADARTVRSAVKGIQAFSEGRGYATAPMSRLHLNRQEADLALQKGLNDSSKRHHVRFWKLPSDWNAEEVWIGAATRDIEFAYLRRGGGPITHRIEQDVDRERDKIINDLAFTSCVDSVGWISRPNLHRLSRNATGDLMSTDGRVAVIRLSRCTVSPEAPKADESPIRTSGNVAYRFARREILSFRNDVIRNNVYWRALEGGWWLVRTIRRHARPAGLDPDPCYRVPRSPSVIAAVKAPASVSVQ